MKVRKKPLYEFGELPPSRYGVPVVNYYESDFGATHLVGNPLYRALGAHKTLKHPKKGGRQCYRNCGPCAAEPALNTFLSVVWAAGGVVKSIREDW